MRLGLTTLFANSAHTVDLQRRKNTNACVNFDLSEADLSGTNLNEVARNSASRATPNVASIEAIG